MDSLAPKTPLEEVADLQAMSPCSISSSLKKVYCMKEGQLTPPSSPESSACLPVSRKFSTRLPQPTATSRLLNDTETTTCSSKSKSSGQYDGSPDAQKPALYGPASKSVQLDVTSLSNRARPTLSRKSVKEVGRLMPGELRRTSLSYHNLRDIAHEQEQHIVSRPGGLTPTSLLPSPLIDDRSRDTTSPTTNHNEWSNYRRFKETRSVDNSYENLQILSYYEGDQSPATENSDKDETNTTSTTISTSILSHVDHNRTRQSSHVRCKKPSESSVESAESSWLANTTSHEERMRRFKSRCTQVVQHSVQAESLRHDEDSKIMLATMIVGPGKPRLVQIERPPSSNSSVPSHGQTSHSLFGQESPPLTLTIAPPSTPNQPQQKDVSAFSPYDTPSIITPLAHRSHANRRSVSSPVEQTPFTASKINLVPQPLAISRRASSNSARFMGNGAGCPEHDSGEVFTFPPHVFSQVSTVSRDTAATGLTFGSGNGSATDTSSQMSFGSKDHRKLTILLDATTKAIEAFPRSMIYLDSPAVVGIRNSSTRETNEVHIVNLSGIFPGASRELLSTLAAWIIIDSYLTDLDKDRASKEPVGGKLRSRFSFRRGHAPRRSLSMPVNVSAFKSRPRPIHVPSDTSRSLRSFASSHLSSDLEGIAFRSGESVNSIPSKACSILGIDQARSCSLVHETLMSQARALTISVGVIAQKLLETLRGGRGWDAQLWRSLRIMIKMTEENNNLVVRQEHIVRPENHEIDGIPRHVAYEGLNCADGLGSKRVRDHGVIDESDSVYNREATFFGPNRWL